MKKFLFLGIGSALMFTMGGVGPAQADNGVHFSTASGANVTGVTATAAGAGRCAGCHRTHTAKAAMLLKEAQPALCYTCHGGGAGANTDVQNGTSGQFGAALRGGGFEYALIGAGAATKDMGDVTSHGVSSINQTVPVGAQEATTSKHEIDGTTSGTMWGNGAISSEVNLGKAGVVLECGSCHDPHGNGNYRILKPVPNDADPVSIVLKPAVMAADGVTVVTPAVMTSAEGVNIPDAITKVYTTENYWAVQDPAVPLVKGGVAPVAGTLDGYIDNVSQWCSTCHTRYLAQAPAYGTDSGDAVFTYRHTSNKTNKGGVNRPNCIQCHVSHGSNAAMTGSSVGLNPGDTAAPAGDSRLLRVDQRGTCVMCHNV